MNQHFDIAPNSTTSSDDWKMQTTIVGHSHRSIQMQALESSTIMNPPSPWFTNHHEPTICNQSEKHRLHWQVAKLTVLLGRDLVHH